MEEVYKALSLPVYAAAVVAVACTAAAAVATITDVVAPCCCSFLLRRYVSKATLYGRYILYAENDAFELLIEISLSVIIFRGKLREARSFNEIV